MRTNMWVVVRFPDGSWSSGGKASSPEYECCEVYKVPAAGREEAEKRAKAIRKQLIRKKSELPSQAAPFVDLPVNP